MELASIWKKFDRTTKSVLPKGKNSPPYSWLSEQKLPSLDFKHFVRSRPWKPVQQPFAATPQSSAATEPRFPKECFFVSPFRPPIRYQTTKTSLPFGMNFGSYPDNPKEEQIPNLGVARSNRAGITSMRASNTSLLEPELSKALKWGLPPIAFLF